MVGSKSSRRRGFSLIELIVSVVVLAILAALAVPSFRSIMAIQRLKNASFDLVSALSYARSEAIRTNGNISLRAGAAAATTTWSTGFRVDDGTNVLRSWTVTSTLTLAEKSGTPQTLITFGRDGRLATTPAPKLEFASAATLTGVSPRCVRVDLSGRPITQAGACP